MSKKRKKYTPAEKAKIALEAIKSEHHIDAFSDKNKQEATTQESELAELYEQIGRLKVENDFLKKVQGVQRMKEKVGLRQIIRCCLFGANAKYWI